MFGKLYFVMILRYLGFLLFMAIGLNGFGQMSSPSAYFEATEYSDSNFIFVFCGDVVSAGQLTASDSTEAGGFDFTWFKYNEISQDFTDIVSGFTINNDSTRSTATGLTNGGYKVILNDGSTIQEYIAWVYINNELGVEIKFHKENDCDFLALTVEPSYYISTYFNTPLTYYDVSTGQSYVLRNKMNSYVWTSDPSEDDFRSFNGPYTSIVEDASDNDSELPTEFTIFSVIATDRFGCIAEDDIEYTAIETDADFSWTKLDDRTDEILETGNSDSEVSGSAPLKLKFTNESLNSESYIWFFGDTLWNNDIDTVKTDDHLEEPEHTYYFSEADTGKTYVLRMYSKNEFGCVDSIFFNIKVEASKIEFPNVFTPNGDQINDIFHVDSIGEGPISIRNFKITIFSQAGQLVHEYEGDVRDWKGWDGKVKNSNRDAIEGNYFYVVEIDGWDNVSYNNKNWNSRTVEENSGGEGTSTGGSTTKSKFGVIRLFRGSY